MSDSDSSSDGDFAPVVRRAAVAEGSDSGSDSGSDLAPTSRRTPARSARVDEYSSSDSGGGASGDEKAMSQLRKGKRKGKGRGPTKKRARGGGGAAGGDDVQRKYFQDEAEDEDEEVYASRTADEEIARANAVYMRERELADNRKKDALETRTAAEIAEYFQDRERSERYTERRIEETARDMVHAPQQADLPDVTDPKLWLLNCKEGKEQEIMIALMNKYITLTGRGEPPMIMSAVFTYKGNILVEAYREMHVKNAVSGISNLYGWKPGAIRMVELDKMPNSISISASASTIKKGDFVRFKRGVFKDDLCKVLDVREGGSKLEVKLVPRIDLTAVGLTPAERKARSRSARPPQRIFDESEIREASNGQADLHRARGATVWGSNRYVDGFLIKQVNATAITTEGAAPTLDELQQFKPTNPDEDDGGLGIPSAGSKTTEPIKLTQGDKVVVTAGDLKNLTGRVDSIIGNGAKFYMIADNAKELGIDGPIEMFAEEVMKQFEVGEHVKVVGGRYMGETGMVLETVPGATDDEEWIAILFLDGNSREIQVFVKDIQTSSEVATNLGAIDGIEMYDLVELANKEVGVVVAIGRGDLSIVTPRNTTRTIKPNQIMRTLNHASKKNAALDKNSHHIGVGDVVRVIAGDFTGQDGTIKHVHRMQLFLHTHTQPTNAGIFAVRAKHVVMAGNKSRNAAVGSRYMGVLDALASEGSGSVRIGGRGRGRGRDPLQSMTVKITKGIHKGKVGRVKSATAVKVCVELHSSHKPVTVNKMAVRVIGDPHGKPISGGQVVAGGTVPGFGGATPGMGGETPGLGGRTPGLAGSSTPHMGGATPAFGGATPGYGGATPGYGGATPGYGGATPGYGGATPGYGGIGGATPAYGGATPAYGGATPSGSRTPMVSTGTAWESGSSDVWESHRDDDTGYDRTDRAVPSVTWYAPSVKVTGSGVHSGKVGTIKDVEAGECVVEWSTGTQDRVSPDDLRGVFSGQSMSHVRIGEGLHAGETGIVFAYDDDSGDAVVTLGASKETFHRDHLFEIEM